MSNTTNTEEPLISCFQLGFQTPLGRIDPVTIQVHEHEWLEITGPAGAGKSLFFEILSLRTILPTAKVVVQRRNLARTPRHEIAEMRRMVGSCSQQPRFLEDRTVCENLVLPMVARRRIEGALESAEALLEEFSVPHLRDLRVRDLSYQDRILVAVMRAYVGKPKVIMLDSLFDTVSLPYQNTIFDSIHRRFNDGVTMVLFAVAPTAMNSAARIVELEVPEW